MTRKGKSKTDWPAVAAVLVHEISHRDMHPSVMLRALADHQRGRRGQKPSRWALAFSGGADSLAMLLIFWAEGPGRWGRDFVVLHFDHRLRGRESTEDARFCEAVCRALGVTCVVGKWKDARKGASEAEAREARHAFFAREMKRRKLRLLFLAHQQDDIAETMLMRLARGSGAGGLAAPRPAQEVADGRVHLRPMLTLKKAAIETALRKAGALWREDASNRREEHFRNRVRRSVLPAWQKAAGRDAVAGAARARELLEEDEVALEAWVDRLGALRRGVLNVQALHGLPRAVVRRALHRWLLAVRPETDLSRQGFAVLLAAVEQGRATRFSLGRTDFAVIRRGSLALKRG
ncbi:MAG: tRNA(Ile)-lysidine synthase [Verrucomicrobiota bacterium]|nr:tRNA(Ile)-lysidine synthase [Verrucomicrobiota bacterium]